MKQNTTFVINPKQTCPEGVKKLVPGAWSVCCYPDCGVALRETRNIICSCTAEFRNAFIHLFICYTSRKSPRHVKMDHNQQHERWQNTGKHIISGTQVRIVVGLCLSVALWWLCDVKQSFTDTPLWPQCWGRWYGRLQLFSTPPCQVFIVCSKTILKNTYLDVFFIV